MRSWFCGKKYIEWHKTTGIWGKEADSEMGARLTVRYSSIDGCGCTVERSAFFKMDQSEERRFLIFWFNHKTRIT